MSCHRKCYGKVEDKAMSDIQELMSKVPPVSKMCIKKYFSITNSLTLQEMSEVIEKIAVIVEDCFSQ